MQQYVTPKTLTAEKLKQKRKALGLTQKELAELIGVSKPTVERWETAETSITGPVVLLMQLLTQDYLAKVAIPEKQFPLRLWYMNNDMVCTLIDVDEGKKTIAIKNYTELVQFRAFGANEAPTFEDYEEFLRSRSFPESRDQLKLVLKNLNLPFYDPLMIIEKTEGRMAEDNFSLRIEK